MKISKFYIVRLWIVSTVVVFSAQSGCGCAPHSNPLTTLTNYSDTSNWFKNPKGSTDKPVDVFFLYPTIYYGADSSCAVTDEQMRNNAPFVYDKQASVYEQSCNVYMPFYRQLGLGILLTPFDARAAVIDEIPAQDCIAALEYYFEHYNNGKPFILAGHSQGSAVLLSVMEYMKTKPEELKRMIVSYVIGYGVTQSYLDKNPHLKFADKADDTGVIVSWNIEGPVIESPNPLIIDGTVVINPILWTTDTTHATAQHSLGSRVMGEDNQYHKIMNYADAQINRDRHSVICTKVDPSKYTIPFFPAGAMHGGDYELYYYDLQNNVKVRIQAYLNR